MRGICTRCQRQHEGMAGYAQSVKMRRHLYVSPFSASRSMYSRAIKSSMRFLMTCDTTRLVTKQQQHRRNQALQGVALVGRA